MTVSIYLYYFISCVLLFPAQLVHDELEYIKMRYRSPARSSFRDPPKQPFNMNKAYDTITPTTQTSTYTDNSHKTTNKNSKDSTPGNNNSGHGGNGQDYHSDDSLGPLPPSSVSSQRKILGSSESRRKNRRPNTENEENENGRRNAQSPDLWGTGQSTSSTGQGKHSQSVPDFGYESYDSRHHLVVGPPQSQTVI